MQELYKGVSWWFYFFGALLGRMLRLPRSLILNDNPIAILYFYIYIHLHSSHLELADILPKDVKYDKFAPPFVYKGRNDYGKTAIIISIFSNISLYV